MNHSTANPSSDLLSVTAFLSALTHVIIILGISFKLPDIGARPSTDNTLDVVLLNSSNNEESEDAELISSSNNAGGGTDDRDGATREPWKAVNPSELQSVKKRTSQSFESTLTPDQYLTAKQGELSVQRTPPKENKLASREATIGKDKFNANDIRLERERLLAKISQQQEEYNRRPRKAFLSPTTKEHGAAKYLDAWKKRVVSVGNANYPIQIKAKKLHGSLLVSIEINRNGTIAAIDVLSPSKHNLLNETAKRILRDASPFAAFPEDDYFRNTDILVITRMIHFLPDNRFASTAARRGRG